MTMKQLKGKHCFQLFSLDVLGSEKDGYEVNQIYSQGFFFITDYNIPTFGKIVAALKKHNVLKKRFRFTSEYPYDTMEVIQYKGCPIYEVMEVDMPEFFGRWFTSFPRTQNAIVLKEGHNGVLRRIEIA